MRKLLMNIYKWSFLVLITAIWILLYQEDMIKDFDTPQWGIMIMLTFIAIFAFSLLQWSFKEPKKEKSELFTRYWKNIDS